MCAAPAGHIQGLPRGRGSMRHSRRGFPRCLAPAACPTWQPTYALLCLPWAQHPLPTLQPRGNLSGPPCPSHAASGAPDGEECEGEVGRDLGVGVQAHQLRVLEPRPRKLSQRLGHGRAEQQRLAAGGELGQDLWWWWRRWGGARQLSTGRGGARACSQESLLLEAGQVGSGAWAEPGARHARDTLQRTL